ncbi:MAG: DoxX family protein [Gemmatimonadota bacterium]
MFKFSITQHRIAMLVLRLIVGLVFFAHGYQKAFQMGPDMVAGFFGSAGIPAPAITAWLITLLETFGAAALMLGLLTRVFATLFALDMLGAMSFIHFEQGFSVANNGYEFVLTLFAASVALAIAGPGAAAIDDLLARRKEARAA